MSITTKHTPSLPQEDLFLQRQKWIFWMPVEHLRDIHEPRDYQVSILHRTRMDILRGKTQWRWDIAVWWGKTYMALSMMKHIASRWGKILYLTPGNTELNNVLSSHMDKYKLGDSNLIKFREECDILGVADPKQRKLYDALPYHYSTGQMLLYEQRYKQIPPDYYDAIFFDESQWFLWEQMSELLHYFQWAKVCMSATPYNNKKHLENHVSHRYGGITSDELIEYHGYPKWIIKNYHVDEWDAEEEIDGDFDFENNSVHHDRLNINERFSILEFLIFALFYFKEVRNFFSIFLDVIVYYFCASNYLLFHIAFFISEFLI